MTVELLISFTTFFLEYQNFVCLYMIYDSSLHISSLDIRGTDFYRSVVIGQKDFAEIQGSTFLTVKTVNENFLSLFNFELLSCNIYNCVHLKFNVKS